MNLFHAHSQWATRPADERFASISELYAATKAYAKQAMEADNIPYSTLRVEASADDMLLVGKAGKHAKLTNWSFGQLSARVAAPAGYLRTLPGTLAAQNLNHGLKHRGEKEDGNNASLLLHSNGSLVCRSITSDKYARIWNYEVAERLLNADAKGWTTPKAYRSNDSENAGLYASDHDMFVFLVNNENRIKDGTDEGLGRGLFVQNSEVGACALKITQFLYRYVCGNHIVWGAKDVQTLSVRHIGNINDRSEQIFEALATRFSNESVSDVEAQIASARRLVLGKTKEEVLDYIFGKKLMARKAIEEAYDACLPEVDGSPNTLWGLMQGATRVSQETQYADVRAEKDAIAGKLMKLAF